jgi:hypothetical protein
VKKYLQMKEQPIKPLGEKPPQRFNPERPARKGKMKWAEQTNKQ